MAVTLQIRRNGGAPQTGAVTFAVGDTCQLRAANYSTFLSSPSPARFEIYSYPPAFTCPAGWTEDPTSHVFYWLGNSDPPSFVTDEWGKYATRLMAYESSGATTDKSSAITIPSDNGLQDLMSGEGSQFGGPVRAWTGGQQDNLRAIDAALNAALSATTIEESSGNGSGTITIVALPSGHEPGLYRVELAAFVITATAAGTMTPNIAYTDMTGTPVGATAVSIARSLTATGPHLIPSILIQSDGSDDITVTFTMAGVSGTGVITCTAALTYLD